jgi:hypothetical protein
MKLTDDYTARLTIRAREARVHPLPAFAGLPRFGWKKFSSWEEFNAWKSDHRKQMTEARPVGHPMPGTEGEGRQPLSQS